MFLTFTGYFVLDALMLAFILAMPVPSTPFLIYLILNLPIIEFACLYLIASNLYVSLVYIAGIYLDKVNFKSYLSKINITTQHPKMDKLKVWRASAYDLALKKLKNISAWNIMVIRTIGVHSTLISFGSGMVRGNYLSIIIANTLLAILDIIFYWVLLGTGKILFMKIFPDANIEYYLTEYFFQTITISLITFYFIYFFVKYFKYKKSK